MKAKRCVHCDALFITDRFHPNQRFCSDDACKADRRKAYKKEYNKDWRSKNPNYFKEYWVTYRELKK